MHVNAQTHTIEVSDVRDPGISYGYGRPTQCKSNDLYWNGPSRTIELLCLAEYQSCLSHQSKTDAMNDVRKKNCDFQTLPLDNRYAGQCPHTLMAHENSDYDTPSWWVARALLRKNFTRTTGDRGISWSYRHSETMRKLLELSKDDPTDLSVLNALWLVNEYERSSLESIRLSIALLKADSDCEYKYNTFNRLAHDLDDLVRGHNDLVHGLPAKTDQEIRELANTYFDVMSTTYVRDYHRFNNLRKVLSALRTIHSPLFYKSEDYVYLPKVVDLIDVDLEDFRREHQSFFLDDLTHTYAVDSLNGRAQSLGMICNDWAFELGLVEHCGTLVSHYIQADLETQTTLNDDVFNAAVVLLLAVTRNCDEKQNLAIKKYDFMRTTLCQNGSSTAESREVVKLLGRLQVLDGDPSSWLLKAYAALSERTPAFFNLALGVELSALQHALPLAKRLQKADKLNEAIELVESAYVVAKAANLDSVLHDRKFFAIAGYADDWWGFHDFSLFQKVAGGEGREVSTEDVILEVKCHNCTRHGGERVEVNTEQITSSLQQALELLRAGNDIWFPDAGLTFLDVNS